MATDVRTICDASARLHEIWASLIEIILAVWLLEAQIGFRNLRAIRCGRGYGARNFSSVQVYVESTKGLNGRYSNQD